MIVAYEHVSSLNLSKSKRGGSDCHTLRVVSTARHATDVYNALIERSLPVSNFVTKVVPFLDCMQIGAQLSTAVQRALAASGITTPTAGKAQHSSQQPGSASKRQKHAAEQTQQLAQDALPTANPASTLIDSEQSTPAVTASNKNSQAGTKKSPAVIQSTAKSSGVHMASGDDLGDEFAIEIDAAEDEGAKKKTKKMTGGSVTETDTGKGRDQAAPSKKSKHKVVQF